MNIEEYLEKIADLSRELKATACPIWQCGGDLEPIEIDTNWQTPDLKCKNCGAYFQFKKKLTK